MISVVIPAYNASATLARALDSCLKQAQVSQVVVIDDASQDATFEIASAWASAHPVIEVHRLPSNQGAAAARNFGAQWAQHNALAFLDADDCFLPQALHIAAQGLQEHARLAAVKLPCAFEDVPSHVSAHPMFKEACAILTNTFAGNLVIRREIFALFGGFSTHPIFRTKGGEDGAFMLALSRFFTIGLLHQDPPCVQIFLRGNSHSLRFFEHYFSHGTKPIQHMDDPSDSEVWDQSLAYVAAVQHRLQQAQWPCDPHPKGFVPIWAK